MEKHSPKCRDQTPIDQKDFEERESSKLIHGEPVPWLQKTREWRRFRLVYFASKGPQDRGYIPKMM